MGKITLALDMGGSAIKAGLFDDNKLIKTDFWKHQCNDCGLSNAKGSLLLKCNEFSGGKVDSVGLGIAGLLNSNGTVFESTLMSSFNSFNIGEFLKKELCALSYSQDNDADCGAVGEFYFSDNKSELLYIVIGSGIGSAALDKEGHILYRIRIDGNKPYSQNMNHPISDAGLILDATPNEIQEILQKAAPELDFRHNAALDHLRDKKGNIKLGQLGSAIGVYNILHAILDKPLNSQRFYQYYRSFTDKIANLKDLNENRYAARIIASLAQLGETKSRQAYQAMGAFLGLTIAKAEKILLEDYGKLFPIHVGGNILGSRKLFWDEMINEINKNNIQVECILSNAFTKNENSNLWGAYLRAQNA